jgi:hypothetical protein
MEAVTHGRFGRLKGRPTIFLPAPGGLSAADRAQPPRADDKKGDGTTEDAKSSVGNRHPHSGDSRHATKHHHSQADDVKQKSGGRRAGGGARSTASTGGQRRVPIVRERTI